MMMQVLLETGTRVSEFVALRVEDVSLAERAIVIEDGKGGKRREVPMRPELARLLALHIGRRRSGPLFVSRQKRADGRPPAFTRQRIGQMVRQVAVTLGSASVSIPTSCATPWRPGCWPSAWTSPTCRSSSA